MKPFRQRSLGVLSTKHSFIERNCFKKYHFENICLCNKDMTLLSMILWKVVIHMTTFSNKLTYRNDVHFYNTCDAYWNSQYCHSVTALAFLGTYSNNNFIIRCSIPCKNHRYHKKNQAPYSSLFLLKNDFYRLRDWLLKQIFK